MRKLMAAAALTAMLPAAGQAASLGLVTEEYPAFLDSIEFFWAFGEITGFGFGGGEIVDAGGPLVTGLETFLTAAIAPDGSVDAAGGALLVSDFGANEYSGTLLDFGWVIGTGTDTLEFLFSIAGSGIEVLATITGEFGEDALAPFFAGPDVDDPFEGSLRIAQVARAPAPIPLPAGGVLLLTAVGALALRRRS